VKNEPEKLAAIVGHAGNSSVMSRRGRAAYGSVAAIIVLAFVPAYPSFWRMERHLPNSGERPVETRPIPPPVRTARGFEVS